MNPKTYFTPANGYNPRFGTRSKAPVASVKYSVEDVWAAAAAAQRINGEYLKEDRVQFSADTGERTVIRQRNRDVMMGLLADTSGITDRDRAQGQECRRFLQNDLTLRGLKGKLSDFDLSVSRVIAVESEFDSAQHRLELAVVACLPQSHQRGLAQQESQDRLRQCQVLDSAPGAKVMLNDVEVVRSSYSQQYGIFWITAVTADNHAVFFGYRQGFDAGTHLTIAGTVKVHREGKTQLTRVKVL